MRRGVVVTAQDEVSVRVGRHADRGVAHLVSSWSSARSEIDVSAE